MGADPVDDVPGPVDDDLDARKRELRRVMRARRRALPDLDARSARLWSHVESLDEIRVASRVLAFESIHGEPVTGPFVQRLRARGVDVVIAAVGPAAEAVDPAALDAVVVPGLAFTVAGARLGQGGGWYDRVLPHVGPGCTIVGVAFSVQVVERLPIAPHDVAVDLLVTEEGLVGGRRLADQSSIRGPRSTRGRGG